VTAAWFCSSALRRLHPPRRIDGGELALESTTICLGNLLDRTHRAQRSDRRAEQRDAGKEEEGFFFGGSWHAAMVARRGEPTVSKPLRG